MYYNNENELENFNAISSSVIGAGLGGIGGYFLAKKVIKKKEKELERKLSDSEKLDILKKYVGIGALGGGTGGAVIHLGVQSKANTGNEKAQKALKILDELPMAPGKGLGKLGDLYEWGDKKKDYLLKRYMQGQSAEDINAEHARAKEAVELGEKVRLKPLSELTAAELAALQTYRDYKNARGMARQAMLMTAGGLALNKFIIPKLAEMKSNGKELSHADEDVIKNIVLQMKEDGKSDEEIERAVEEYVKARNFSLIRW